MSSTTEVKTVEKETLEVAERKMVTLKLVDKETSEVVEQKKVTLTSVDEKTFEVAEAVAMELGHVKQVLENRHPSSADDSVVVPLEKVRSGALERIIAYCEMQVDFKARLASESEEEYDAEFMKGLTNEEARELILAANDLDAKGLKEVLFQEVVVRIENRSVEYVRDFFGIVSDLTPEEEAKIREEYPWAFEGVDD